MVYLPTSFVFLAGASAQIYRYFRVSSPIEKQQTKWVVVGLMGMLVLVFTWLALATFFPPDQPSAARIYALLVGVPLITLSALTLPLTFAFSILRYRLWDIDLVIRRTLTYALLTGLLGLVYFGGIVVFQNLFVGITGQESPLAVVISTLVIASLFNPLRVRVQNLIDRRFFRAKYDAENTLAQFAAAARDEVDVERLTGALLGVVKETMQPEGVSLWLKPVKK